VPVAIDAPAFADVYAGNAAFVWRVLRRMGVRDADLDDACQEVFVVVHRRLPDYDAAKPVRAWLFGICFRFASDYRKRAHRRYETLSDKAADRPVMPAQHEDLDRRRARALLDEFLDSIDDDKRAVFVLYELEQLPMDEIATMIDRPLQTAYSRLRAARQLFDAYVSRLQARSRTS